MKRRPYTAFSRSGGITGILLLAGAFAGMYAQPVHRCPVPGPASSSYTNPLYEKWLSAYDVKHYLLDLTVSHTTTVITGSTDMVFEAIRTMDTLVLELQDALEVTRVQVSRSTGEGKVNSGDPLPFEHLGDALYIPLGQSIPKGQAARVRVEYGGDAGQNRGFFAGIHSARDFDYGFDVTYTLSEPFNARDWFPVKQVLEDKIDSVTIRLHCNRELLAGSNGLLRSIEEDGDMHTLTWHTRYPMAYYLISFAVADYRDLSFQAALSGEGDSVLVQNYIYDSDEVMDDWEEQIRMTGPMITSFSRLLEDYPFAGEKYGHAMAPMGGGMEHQTMTTIQDFDFYLVAHELAHQWFGDFITCGNWQDIWINEGFASYFEYIAAQELLGQEAADLWMDNAMSIALRETRGSVHVPVEQVTNEYRLFDYGLSYKKGAILLHMIRYILDDDTRFFGALRTYLQQYGDGLATGEQFREVLEEATGTDFSCFFDQWYYGEGYPRYTLYWQQEGDSLRVLSQQETSEPSATPFFRMPIELEIRMEEGQPETVRLEQELNEQSYSIPVTGRVEEVRFDPSGALLKSAVVIQELPVTGPVRYGPNPVSDELYIQIPNAGPIENLRITSLSGREVLARSGMGNPVTIDLSMLADGPYLLQLTNNRGTFLERIVKISEN